MEFFHLKSQKLCYLSSLILFTVPFFFCTVNGDDLTLCVRNCRSNGSLSCGETLVSQGRCCLNSTANQTWISALDLVGCNISNAKSMFQNLVQLKVLYLQGNPLKSFTGEDLTNVTQLKTLILPEQISCPGGEDAWQSVYRNSSRLTYCFGEVNICTDRNVTCPNKNSKCVHVGPGNIECLCLNGYHGYKCLRKGTFPTVIYIIALCGSTLVICVALWCVERRKIKKKNK